jgi:hypothetical protein
MKKHFLYLLTFLSLAVPLIAPTAITYAACGTDSDSKGQILQGIGNTGGDCNGKGVMGVIAAVISILSLAIGIIAVIMIIIAGFKYVTSGGDANRVSSAKNTLLYAIVGIVIAALAQIIVKYVLDQSAGK